MVSEGGSQSLKEQRRLCQKSLAQRTGEIIILGNLSRCMEKILGERLVSVIRKKRYYTYVIILVLDIKGGVM